MATNTTIIQTGFTYVMIVGALLWGLQFIATVSAPMQFQLCVDAASVDIGSGETPPIGDCVTALYANAKMCFILSDETIVQEGVPDLIQAIDPTTLQPAIYFLAGMAGLILALTAHCLPWGAGWALLTAPPPKESRDCATIALDVCFALVFVGAINHFFSALLAIGFPSTPCSTVPNAAPVGNTSEVPTFGVFPATGVEGLVQTVQILAGLSAFASFAGKLHYQGKLVFLSRYAVANMGAQVTCSTEAELTSVSATRPDRNGSGSTSCNDCGSTSCNGCRA
jgi:hypothetical protein